MKLTPSLYSSSVWDSLSVAFIAFVALLSVASAAVWLILWRMCSGACAADRFLLALAVIPFAQRCVVLFALALAPFAFWITMALITIERSNGMLDAPPHLEWALWIVTGMTVVLWPLSLPVVEVARIVARRREHWRVV